MTAYLWREQNRETLTELLPDAVVVLPVGATEQHGPHLATATDALLAETVAIRAARQAADTGCSRPLVVAPTLGFGASDHHLPFGGTLSLRTETLLAVLLDLLGSIHRDGGRRVVIVNGHGGNRGVCSAAVAAASTRHVGLTAAYLDYWSLYAERGGVEDPSDLPDWLSVPGHAGEFETSLVLATEPGLVGRAPHRPDGPPSEPEDVPGLELATQANWERIEGFTGDPSRASAELGVRLLERLCAALGVRLKAFAASS